MLLLMFDHHAFSSRDMHSELFLSTSDALHVKFYHVKTCLNHPLKLIAKKKEKKKRTHLTLTCSYVSLNSVWVILDNIAGGTDVKLKHYTLSCKNHRFQALKLTL